MNEAIELLETERVGLLARVTAIETALDALRGADTNGSSRPAATRDTDTDRPAKRRGGRPKGSKNKSKEPVSPIAELTDEDERNAHRFDAE